MFKTRPLMQRRARWTPTGGGRFLAVSVASLTVATGGGVMISPAIAQARPLPRCATPVSKSFTLKLPDYGAQLSGKASFMCRSVDIRGTMTVIGHPTQVVSLARAQGPAFGPSGKLIHLNPVAGHPGEVDSGWQQPADLAGDVGTIQVFLEASNGMYSGVTLVTLHQPAS
jgi:hypothetical protein